MGFFSEELRILDRNTVQYMIDEMQETIDRQKEQLSQKDEQLLQTTHKLHNALSRIAELENK